MLDVDRIILVDPGIVSMLSGKKDMNCTEMSTRDLSNEYHVKLFAYLVWWKLFTLSSSISKGSLVSLFNNMACHMVVTIYVDGCQEYTRDEYNSCHVRRREEWCLRQVHRSIFRRDVFEGFEVFKEAYELCRRAATFCLHYIVVSSRHALNTFRFKAAPLTREI